MQLNFIITCFNKEAYWPHLLKVLQSYKTVVPKYCLVYNGNSDDFRTKATVIVSNRGHSQGEFDMIKAGYEHFISSTSACPRFVKTSIDSWLCNENVLLSIFKELESKKACYCGNFWNEYNTELSSDIFFTDERFGSVLSEFKEDGSPLEACFYNAVKRLARPFLIVAERHPVHPHRRWFVDSLGWTMEHELSKNIQNRNKYALSKLLRATFLYYAREPTASRPTVPILRPHIRYARPKNIARSAEALINNRHTAPVRRLH